MQFETVSVVRPIKVLALVCGIIGCILLIVCIAANSWIEATDFQQGLWQVCRDDIGDIKNCDKNESTAWILACAALCIISLLVAVVAVILNGVGLGSKDKDAKCKFYRSATFIMFAACACQVVSLIVFPIMFVEELDQKSATEGKTEWYFAWSYGIGWGAAIFEVGAAILLLIDKENDEIYYKEKSTVYRDSDA